MPFEATAILSIGSSRNREFPERLMVAPVDLEAQLRDAIEEAGLTPPAEIMADGNIHRFASNGSPRDDAGWYVVYPDGIPAGTFGCWRTDVKRTWRADIGRPLTDTEREQHRTKVAEAQRKHEVEKLRRQEDAATEANRIWEAAQPAQNDHPYLVRKGVKAHGLRHHHDGRLVVPVRIGNVIRSLQYIDETGKKLFMEGGEIPGGYFPVGSLDGAEALCIVEGFATGATIHEATGYPVAVAFNVGNLHRVVEESSHWSLPVQVYSL